jgi:hypothetical protein
MRKPLKELLPKPTRGYYWIVYRDRDNIWVRLAPTPDKFIFDRAKVIEGMTSVMTLNYNPRTGRDVSTPRAYADVVTSLAQEAARLVSIADVRESKRASRRQREREMKNRFKNLTGVYR